MLRVAFAGRETINVSMETVDTTSTECNNQQPSKPQVYNPPPIKRILGFDAGFNPCLYRASYRSRNIKDTPVYINDRAGVVAHEGAKNEVAFAEQNALNIVKQTRSSCKMRHTLRMTCTVDDEKQPTYEEMVATVIHTDSLLL